MTDQISFPPLLDLSSDELEAQRQHLLNEIAREPKRTRLFLFDFTIARLRLRFALPAVAVIGAAVAAAVTLLPAGSGGPGSASAAVFNRLATRIAAQSWTPGPGQYLYLDTESEWGAIAPRPDGTSCETRSVERNQSWVGADGSGLTRETKQAGHFTSPADHAACLALATAGKNAAATLKYMLAPRSSDAWFAPNCMGYGQNTDWSRFSSDPHTLLQQIDQLYHSTDPTPSEEFKYIEETLGQSNPPPDVVANIYRAAALIRGVQSLGTVQDHAGRSGLGLSIALSPPAHYGTTAPYGTTEMIFDAQTGRLLGQTDTGQLAGWNVYLHKEIVNQLPTNPPVPLTPACTTTGGGTIEDIPGGSVMTGKS